METSLEQLAQDFLEKHKNAYEIVWDTKYSIPLKAIYRRWDDTEAEYWFGEFCDGQS